MRKKEVKIDDVAYTISPLSLSQVTKFLQSHRAALGIDKKGEKIGESNPEALEIVWREFICMGLNNAGKDVEGFVLWTPQRIDDELDTKIFETMRADLLEFSSLKPEKENTAPGEATAAS